MQVGEEWAFRGQGHSATLERVEIQHVVPRPRRDRYVIRFEDGRQREVAQTTLVCPWNEAEVLQARLEMEALVHHQQGEHRAGVAVERVLSLLPTDVAEVDRGRVLIRDESRLESMLGVRAQDLYTECGGIPKDGGTLTSALAAERIAVAVCQRYPAAALSTVSDSEKGDVGDSDRYDPYRGVRWGQADARDAVRRWCGLHAVERFEGWADVRDGLAHLGELVEVVREVASRLPASVRAT